MKPRPLPISLCLLAFSAIVKQPKMPRQSLPGLPKDDKLPPSSMQPT